MIKEILAKGQAKVKWGQIVRFTRMAYQIVRLTVLCKVYTFTKFGHPVLK